MPYAHKVLVVGGVLNLLWGLLTGFPLTRARMSSPEAPKYLALTHVGGLMWAPILLSLVFAFELSDLGTVLEALSAWAFVLASVVLDAKDFVNWRQGVRDEFAEKPVGYTLGGVSAVLSTGAAAVLAVGVVRGL